jgi:dynein heavy chain
MDPGGWYDRKDNKHPFRTLEDMMCIAAMGPPGGGKSFITPRFQRHFNLVGFMNFEDSTMRQIFGTILKWYFAQGEFKQEVELMEPKLVKATLSFYKKIQEDLKPTPAKSHYTFNLRDFSKVICGICLCTAKEVTAQETVMRLWAHEITRVFGDRLTTNEDMEWLINNVKEFTKMDLGTSFDMLCKHLDLDRNGKVETLDEYRGLLFGDIFAPFQNPDRPYEEILDKKKLQKQAEEQLESYNA